MVVVETALFGSDEDRTPPSGSQVAPRGGRESDFATLNRKEERRWKEYENEKKVKLVIRGLEVGGVEGPEEGASSAERRSEIYETGSNSRYDGGRITRLPMRTGLSAAQDGGQEEVCRGGLAVHGQVRQSQHGSAACARIKIRTG